jgi:predicted RNA-binding Zn-ribbon protein involved in translation (DUF1610 family)
MEFEYKCPKCGKVEIFKSQKTVDRKIANNELCRNCKVKEKQASEYYSRLCPKCGKEIVYKYKSDFNKATKNNSLCKSCAVSKSSIFQKGHNLNDEWTLRENSLDKLISEKSLETFYWVGFILADGNFYNNRFELGLKEDDIDVLKSFADYIEFKGDIKHRDSTNSNRIQFNNKPSIEKLMKEYGFNCDKTHNPCSFESFKDYSKEQITSLLIGIIDGDGNIQENGSTYTNTITITAHNSWKNFYTELLTFLGIDLHISNIKDSNCISIRIYKREYCIALKQFIINNNLFYFSRKWDKIKLK